MRSLPPRLEELDGVAGGILEEDLGPAWPGHDVVAEMNPRRAEPLNLCREVFDNEVDSVPATRTGLTAIRHRAPGGACRSAQQQPKSPRTTSAKAGRVLDRVVKPRWDV